MDGTVIEQTGTQYKVQMDDGSVVTASMSGKLRMNYVRILSGDRVTVENKLGGEHTPKITYRYKRP